MPTPFFQPGKSGNPNGRPKKDRALTAILEAAGSESIAVGDKQIAARRLLAKHLWGVAAAGRAVLPDGRVLAPNFGEWADIVRWLFGHIDGPPKAKVELTGGDGTPLLPGVEPFDYDAYARAFTAIVGTIGRDLLTADGGSESLDTTDTDG